MKWEEIIGKKENENNIIGALFKSVYILQKCTFILNQFLN